MSIRKSIFGENNIFQFRPSIIKSNLRIIFENHSNGHGYLLNELSRITWTKDTARENGTFIKSDADETTLTIIRIDLAIVNRNKY